MNSTSPSAFLRAGMVTVGLLILLSVMTTQSPQTVSPQSTIAYSVGTKSSVKSSDTMRKLPKRPGYRLSA